MKNLNRVVGALLALSLYAVSAWAGGYKTRSVPLVWVRTDAAVGGGAYSTVLANGNHPMANFGVAVPVQDTSQAVDIGEHYYRRLVIGRSPFPGAGVASDSTLLGTLFLRGTTATIDTVNVFRDVSADGVTWTVVDSLAYHMHSPQWAAGITAAASDSLRLIFTTRTFPAGNGESNAALTWTAYPGMPIAAITSMGIGDARFVRFRIHLSPGDYVGAGVANGITGRFEFPVEE